MFDCTICGKQSQTKLFIHTVNGTEQEVCYPCFRESVKGFYPTTKRYSNWTTITVLD